MLWKQPLLFGHAGKIIHGPINLIGYIRLQWYEACGGCTFALVVGVHKGGIAVSCCGGGDETKLCRHPTTADRHDNDDKLRQLAVLAATSVRVWRTIWGRQRQAHMVVIITLNHVYWKRQISGVMWRSNNPVKLDKEQVVYGASDRPSTDGRTGSTERPV